MAFRWPSATRHSPAWPIGWVSLLTLFCIVLITCTPGSDGNDSAFTPLLFLPLLMAVLTCKFEFVVLLCLVLSGAVVWQNSHVHHSQLAAMRVLDFTLVAVLGGLYTRRMQTRQQQTEQRLKETDEMLNVSLWINISSSLEDAVDIVLLALGHIRPYHVAAMLLLDEEQEAFMVQGSRGPASDGLPCHQTVRFTEGETEELRLPQYCADTETIPNHSLVRLLPEVRSFALVPLFPASYYPGGLLYIGFDHPRALLPTEFEGLKGFVQRIAIPLQRTHLQERLQGLVYLDAMTGLQNYRGFRVHLAEEVRRSLRYKRPLTLMLMDLDRFKLVNDTHGHPTGDRVLGHIASILRANLRDTDLPARYGGEEFVILCPETDAAEARIVAERVRQAITNSPVPLPEGGFVGVTASIGIASYPASQDEATLLRQADIALYKAKHQGRNQVVLAPSSEETGERIGNVPKVVL